MNKIVLLAATLMVLFASTDALADKKARIRLRRIHRKGNSAAFTINSSRDFIVGSNIYVLYIGTRHFDQSEEDISNPKKHRIVFYIPLSEYNKLKRGSHMYLTYGYVYEESIKEEEMREICHAQHLRCWGLGKLAKRTL